jgi:hypothetical protein
MSNTPNVSRDSFDYSKFYETTVLQQGVPVLDSDWNEEADLQAMRHMLDLYSRLGNVLLPAVPTGLTRGFEVQGIPATTANALITAGFASVYGAIVGTTRTQVPLDVNYEDDENYLTNGTVSSTSGGDTLIDDDKKFEAWLELVGCRVKMTSGASTGVEFEITDVPNETSLECSGGIASAAGGDTYIVKPPVLPASVGVQTDLEFQLWVWWEWVNENEDPNIVNPGVLIETCERRVRRWCIRASSTPYVGTPDLWTYSVRVLPIASVTINPGDTTLVPVLDSGIFIFPELQNIKPFAETRLHTQALVGATEVLLPLGEYYYVGDGSTGATAHKYFELLLGTDDTLVAPDGGRVGIASIWEDATEITSPALTDGWIGGDKQVKLVFDLSDTSYINISTPSMSVKHLVKKTLSEMAELPTDSPEAAVTRGQHARTIIGKTIQKDSSYNRIRTLIPTSTLQGMLESIAEELSKRPRTVPEAIYTMSDNAWVPLFEFGETTGANGATRIMWNKLGECLKTSGCSLVGTDRTVTSEFPGGSGTASVHIEGNVFDPSNGDYMGYLRATKHTVASGVVLDLFDSADWSNWTFESKSESRSVSLAAPSYFDMTTEFLKTLFVADDLRLRKNIQFLSTFEGVDDQRPPQDAPGDKLLVYKCQNADGGTLCVYVESISTSQNSGALLLVSGAEWNGTAWEMHDVGAQQGTQAWMLQIGGNGLTYYYHNESKSRTWNDSEWLSFMRWTSGSDGIRPAYISGNAKGKYIVGLCGTNYHTAQFAVSSAQGITFQPELLDVLDAGSSVTVVADSTTNWDTLPTVYDLNRYGCVVRGFSNSTTPILNYASWHGHIDVAVVAS